MKETDRHRQRKRQIGHRSVETFLLVVHTFASAYSDEVQD